LADETIALKSEEESHAEAQRARSIMSDESLEQVEQQIASARQTGLPTELRGAVLGEIHRELRAAWWERQLARAAVLLLVVGVGMNAVIGFRADAAHDQYARGDRQTVAQSSLVDTAIVIAEATDAATAQRIARQLAAMRGRKLTADEAAAIDSAVHRPASRGATGNKG
jgi:hypothetical protein